MFSKTLEVYDVLDDLVYPAKEKMLETLIVWHECKD
jgi:hypothetical protein